MTPRLLRHAGHEWLVAVGVLVLLMLFASAVAGGLPGPGTASLRLQALAGADGATGLLVADGRALAVGGPGRADAAARLRFELPPAASGDGPWSIWIERTPVDRVWLEGDGWRSPERGFFRPLSNSGSLPSGYLFTLPQDWQGEVALDLHARSDVALALRPRLLDRMEAWQVERRGVAISASIYASLFTIALLALALFSAARDRLFLALFGCATLTLLALSAGNGHIYRVEGLRWLAAWGAQGLLALAIDRGCIVLVALAALCLLGLAALLPWLQPAALAARVACAAACLLLVADAARRGIPMAWPLLVLALLTVAAGAGAALAMRGQIGDQGWLRPGGQIGLAASMAILAVGMISRISDYRDQRDRDQLARLDSERRMQREAARADLNGALQAKLRGCAEGDIEWTAFRLLLDHLVPLVGADSALALARGYHGQDVQVVLPVERKAQVEARAVERELALRRHAANGIPMQQPVSTATAGKVSMEALVPLQIRAPAWGLLLLERAGGEGFTTEELALAGEFARLALVHVDQALAAIQLRRSAELDALTGTFNRRTIDQWLVRSFGEAERDGQPISVLFVDMDHFKAINDKYGHACGDECLRSVARTLRAALGEGDLLGRYGGEEFIAVLPGRGGAAARIVGEQLRGEVERLGIGWEDQTLRLTVSVGVATRLPGDVRPADTIDRADKALYTAKRSGRNCVHVAPAVFS